MISREKGQHYTYFFFDGVQAAKCAAEKVNRLVRSQNDQRNRCVACFNCGRWPDSGRQSPFDMDKFLTFLSERGMIPACCPSTEAWEIESCKDQGSLNESLRGQGAIYASE